MIQSNLKKWCGATPPSGMVLFDVKLDIEAAALPVREEDYRSWFYLVFPPVI